MKTVIIAGPTGSGKTGLGIKLCKKFNGVIINADSRQVYRGMDIGTNKGDVSENGDDIKLGDDVFIGYDIDSVTGYLFNILEPDEQFDVSRFQKLSVKLISYLNKIGKVPFLTGGTGLYIDSLIKGYDLHNGPPLLELRKELDTMEVIDLQDRLKEVDNKRFESLNDSDKGNPRRLIRAIEKSMSPALSNNIDKEESISTIIIYPNIERDKLYSNINKTVDDMFDRGFVHELERLIKAGFKDSPILQSMGYSDVISYLDGQIDYDACKEKVKVAYRNYAKRQITWFEGIGRGYDLQRFDFQSQYDDIVKAVDNFINS